MLEIDVTDFIENQNMSDYFASIAESGRSDIGTKTWNKARRSKFQYVTKDNKKEFIAWLNEFGAWNNLNRWSLKSLNGLFLQFVAGDYKESQHYESWKEYEQAQKDSQASGYLYKREGKIYFELTH